MSQFEQTPNSFNHDGWHYYRWTDQLRILHQGNKVTWVDGLTYHFKRMLNTDNHTEEIHPDEYEAARALALPADGPVVP